jgi:hypothetical protein
MEGGVVEGLSESPILLSHYQSLSQTAFPLTILIERYISFIFITIVRLTSIKKAKGRRFHGTA